MNETIQNTEATTASPSNSAAILTGAALLGGAALFAKPKAARAQTKTPITFNAANFGPKTGDVQVLNFALALEALETELYIQALQRLTTGGTGGPSALPGAQITGLNQSSSSAAVDYLTQFGKVEQAHFNFLNGALGSSAIVAPGNALFGAKFDFGIQNLNLAGVVELVRVAEATGVMAYLGAIPEFSPTSIYLQTAAAIQGTEARHTAVITAILNGISGGAPMDVAPTAPTANPSDGRDITTTKPQQILDMVRPFIVLRGEAGNPAA